jgi:hypothetical protein
VTVELKPPREPSAFRLIAECGPFGLKYGKNEES